MDPLVVEDYRARSDESRSPERALPDCLDPAQRNRSAPPMPLLQRHARWLKTLWARYFTLPLLRFRDEVLLRRQWERFYLVFGGHIFFQTLRTAVKLDLFSLLSRQGPQSRSQIARELGIEEQPARILLLGLTSTGLLRKRGATYSNSLLAERLLVRGRPGNATAYIELQHQAMYKAMPWMYEAVRENRNVGLEEFRGDEPTIYQRLAHYPDLEQIFQEAMRELSTHANRGLARFVDFSNVKHVVDVGGGDGTNLIALAREWPHLRGTIFDFPTVCEIAHRHIEASGLSDRLDAVPGDCFVDVFPTGADCFLFCHFFTMWSEQNDRHLLKKAFDALPSGGKVIVFNMMQRDDETGPLTAAIGSPYFLTLATGRGMLYSWVEYERWVRESGFATVERFLLPRDHGVIVGKKA